MRAAFVALAALFATVASGAAVLETRDIRDYPPCAIHCLHEANRGPCNQRDFSCLCNNDFWFRSTDDCFSKSCSPQEAQKASWAQDRTCQPYYHDGGHGHHGGGDHGGDVHGGDGHGGDGHGHDGHGH